MKSLVPFLVDIDVACTSKKQVLKTLAARAAEALTVNQTAVFEALISREKLGTTGVGSGVCLPHGIISGIENAKSIFFRLKNAVEFEAVDDEPVDLVFCFLVSDQCPDQNRLLALSKLNKIMMSPDMLASIRGAENRSAVAAIFETAFE